MPETESGRPRPQPASVPHPRPEILAPAGSFAKLRVALRYGADAVYLAAARFGLRASCKNFSEAELALAADYAHARGAKAYVALNALIRDDELDEALACARRLERYGYDALIVSDPGFFARLREALPEMALHVSTQANVSSAASCLFWHRAGAGRIVLSRELTLEQIRHIRAATPATLELECFVHGAMCLAHSGCCLLSAYYSDRSANRGACTQPCRWGYQLCEEGRGGADPLPLEEDAAGSYLLSSRDLCLIRELPLLIEAGIDSFKIEGRAKGLYYAAVTARQYRRARDAYLAGAWPAGPELDALAGELSLVVHRAYGTGFYFGAPRESAQLALGEEYLRPAEVLAVAVDPNEDEAAAQALRGAAYRPPLLDPRAFQRPASAPAASAPPAVPPAEASPEPNPGPRAHASRRATLLRQMNKLRLGELLEVFSPTGEGLRTLRVEALRDLEGRAIESTPHPGQLYYLLSDADIPPLSFLRRRRPESASEGGT